MGHIYLYHFLFTHQLYIFLSAYGVKTRKESIEVTITWAVNNILIGLECWSLIFFFPRLALIY